MDARERELAYAQAQAYMWGRQDQAAPSNNGGRSVWPGGSTEFAHWYVALRHDGHVTIQAAYKRWLKAGRPDVTAPLARS